MQQRIVEDARRAPRYFEANEIEDMVQQQRDRYRHQAGDNVPRPLIRNEANPDQRNYTRMAQPTCSEYHLCHHLLKLKVSIVPCI
jgi:hypothetical protein